MQLFPSANAVFNPSRFAAEQAQLPSQIPGSSVQGQATPFQAFSTRYLPIVVLVVLLWALERKRIGRLAK